MLRWKVASRLCHIRNYLLLWKTLAPLPPRVGAPLPLAAAVKITPGISIMWFDFKQDPTQRTCYNSLGYGCEKFILLSYLTQFLSSFLLNFWCHCCIQKKPQIPISPFCFWNKCLCCVLRWLLLVFLLGESIECTFHFCTCDMQKILSDSLTGLLKLTSLAHRVTKLLFLLAQDQNLLAPGQLINMVIWAMQRSSQLQCKGRNNLRSGSIFISLLK